MVEAGANVTVIGAGTAKNPYVIAAAAGGGGGDRLPGEIIAYSGGVAPAGWLIANGQAVSRVTYAALFAVIGTTFGVGDGANTFNVPDLAGRFPLGADGTYALGSSGGAATAALGINHLPAHNHSITHTHSINHDHASFASGAGGAHNHSVSVQWEDNTSNADGSRIRVTDVGSTTPGGGNNATAYTTTSATHSHTIDVPSFTGTSGASSAANTGDTGSGDDFNVLNPYSAVTFLIHT